MEAKISCPSCGLVVGADEVICPRDGTQLLSAGDSVGMGMAVGPNSTVIDGDDPIALEPTLIRKAKDVKPRASRSEPVSDERTQKWDPLIGERLGEYVVEARIGTGGMGIVYQGRQPEIGKAVAIKVLRPEIADDPEQVRRLLAEARAVNAIGHRGIIDIFSFGRLPDGRQYFVMELLNGVPLDAELAERVQLPTSEVLQLLDDMLAALGAAHAAGVIHRDLKPSNMFLVSQPDGSRYLKILDFGLARQSAVPGASTPQTRNVAVGTAEYMAPEQARGREVGPYTDLYALGVLAFEMVTGRLPFTGASPVETILAHMERPPEHPSVYAPGLHPGVEDLILRLLEKDPKDRPQTAELVRRDIRWLTQELRQSTTQPAAMSQPSSIRTSRPQAPISSTEPLATPLRLEVVADPIATPAAGVLGPAISPGLAHGPNTRPTEAAQPALQQGPTAEVPRLSPRPTSPTEPSIPRLLPVRAAETRPSASYPRPRGARWPIIVTVIAVALTIALGILRWTKSSEAESEPVPSEPLPHEELPRVSPPPEKLPPPAIPTRPPLPKPPEPSFRATEPPAADPAATTPKVRPAFKRPAPTQGALLRQIEAMRQEIVRAAPAGEDPDPTAMALLRRAEEQAHKADDESSRRDLAKRLEAIRANYMRP